MAGIRRRDTGPERALRSLLHAAGRRYRVDMRLDLPGGRVRPDLAFTRAKVAVFVDGCFWHCCPEHGRAPGVNGEYWGPKLTRNVERDHRANQILAEAGWTVLRVWEHEDPTTAATRVTTALTPPRPRELR
jgi:DNA mismatch endonuclease (patch repair protein)